MFEMDPAADAFYFDRIGAVCAATNDILVHHLSRKSDSETALLFLSSECLPYIERAEHGMHQLSRAAAHTRAELVAQVISAGINSAPWPGSPEGLAALIERERERLRAPKKLARADPAELVAFGHARVILGLIPHSPMVSYPVGPLTYEDVPVPRTAGEMALRIEELERTIFRVACGQIWQGDDMRRTFAFFETAAGFTITGFGQSEPL